MQITNESCNSVRKRKEVLVSVLFIEGLHDLVQRFLDGGMITITKELEEVLRGRFSCHLVRTTCEESSSNIINDGIVAVSCLKSLDSSLGIAILARVVSF